MRCRWLLSQASQGSEWQRQHSDQITGKSRQNGQPIASPDPGQGESRHAQLAGLVRVFAAQQEDRMVKILAQLKRMAPEEHQPERSRPASAPVGLLALNTGSTRGAMSRTQPASVAPTPSARTDGVPW